MNLKWVVIILAGVLLIACSQEEAEESSSSVPAGEQQAATVQGEDPATTTQDAEEPPSPWQADEEQAAVESAETWLALVDEGQYGESWDEAAGAFRNAVPRDQWVGMIGSRRPPLGNVLEREMVSTNYATSLPGAPDGEYVVIQFRARFEHRAGAVETVTPMKDADGTWRVSGYYIK